MQLGADPHQLEVLARSMRSAARTLGAIAVSQDSRLRSVTASGPAAIRLDELRVQLAALLRAATDSLVAAARVLDAQALAQRAASLVDPPRVTERLDASGDGRIVERLGRQSASVVVVLVPGVGTDLGDLGELRDDARTVWSTVAAVGERAGGRAARRGGGVDVKGPTGPAATGSADVAVVSWLGYDPPDHVLGGLDGRPATAGARRLVEDVAQFRAAGASRIVVVGHSYGAVVATRAAAESLEADEVVLLGSPGLGVAGLGQLRLRDGGRVWAAAADGDPIALVARVGLVHGPDPLAVARRLPTSLRGHGAYLEDPVLLTALGLLAVGGAPVVSPGS